jgi:hypothetical protein
LETLKEVVGDIHAGLVVETIGCLRVQFGTEELDIGTDLLSCLTSILNFKTGEPEFEVKAEAIVESESCPVSEKSGEENELSNTPIILKPVLSTLF